MSAVTARCALLYLARSRWHILALVFSNDSELRREGVHST